METLEKAHKHEPDTEEYKKLYTRGTKIMEIYNRLGKCSDKDKILKEAREELYDKEFINKLDNALKKVRPFTDYMSNVLTTDENGESLL